MAYTQQTPIGTPDVNLITKTLAGLQPDSALQQYAMMHKNNPYILSLAKSESDRRKALRAAAQGNPGQQPTVADQSIAGMATPVMTGSGGTLQTGYGGPVTTGMASGGLPEDQGIAQLPTPNMQRMADGGIAGYEDDEEGMATGGMGGMFNFAQQSEPVVRMSGGGAIGFSKGGGGLTEMRKLVLKELGETSTNYLQDPEVKRTVDKLVQERLGTTATTATAAKPTAAPSAAPSKSFEAGQKYGPTLRKVGDTLSDIGTTKTSKLPLGGAAKTAGVLGALPAGYEAYQQSDFYKDPNVSSFGKAKQALGTAAKVGIPMLTTGVGSFFGPLGTTGGMLGGGALTAYLDSEGMLTSKEYEDWLKANPQATPEQTKKAAAKFVPTYSPDQQANAEAQRLGLKVNPNTMSKPVEAKEPADTGAGGQGGVGGVGGGGGPGTSAQGIKDMYALFAGKPDERQAKRDAIRGQLGELAGTETLQAQNYYKQLQDDIAARGDYGKEREAKLKGKEERIAKEEGQSGGLALLEAGLAMMSGTSPHAFANIGQGAMAGTAAYRKSMEKITDARDKLDDAYGRLEDVRFNQKNMDTKELREAKLGIDKAANAGLKSLIQFAGQELDMDSKEATTMFGGAVSLEQSRIAAAPGIARNKMLEKRFSGDENKMKEYTKVQKQVMADLKNDTNYATATPEVQAKLMQTRMRQAMLNNPFLSSYAMGIGFESAPTSKGARNEDDDI
jgi:hypothetical protein